jgi:hypothetical protein
LKLDVYMKMSPTYIHMAFPPGIYRYLAQVEDNQKLELAVTDVSLATLTPLTVTDLPLVLVTLMSTESAPNPLLFSKKL